jgi:hypothetical protein
METNQFNKVKKNSLYTQNEFMALTAEIYSDVSRLLSKLIFVFDDKLQEKEKQ